jgi:serine/threonine protein kinase/beta-lactam-binding protein with PASTA domain
MTGVSTDSLIGRVLGDRYRLVSLVGTGASAQVYAAEDLALRRRVGAKVLHPALSGDPRFQKRFRNEAQNAAQMTHPRLLAVYDWNDSDDGAYLVTELLTGGSLRHMLDASKTLSLSQTLVVGLHAAEGLSYAHDLGFVHRDIKPANLLFGDDGRLRIADFGIARAVAEAAWTEPEGSLIGTARYAAPEQSSGGNISESADIYALGLTMVEAVTGEVPLVGTTPLATMVMRQDTDVEVPDELGPLVSVIAGATLADPEQRLSASEMVKQLREVASQLPRPMMLPLSGLEERLSGDRTNPVLPRPYEAETGLAILPDEAQGEEIVDLDSDATDAEAADFAAAATRQIPDTYDPATRWTDDPIPLPELPATAAVEDAPTDPKPGPIKRAFKALGRPKVLIPLLAVMSVIGVLVAFGDRTLPTPAPTTHAVTDFTEVNLTQATEVIETNEWIPNVRLTRVDGTEAGEVISQNVEVGTELAEGATVRLVVSEGPELHLVPELVGLKLFEARQLLTNAGLDPGEVTEFFDEEIPNRQITEMGVPAHSEVETGTSVPVTVSKGPGPRSMPDLRGMTVEEATDTLAGSGLTLAEGEPEYSETVPEGEIIRAIPGPQVEVGRGLEATVFVSLGLPFVTVPNVVGMQAAEAADELVRVGLVVDDTVGAPNRPVLITDPPAGTKVRKGTGVRIITRR